MKLSFSRTATAAAAIALLSLALVGCASERSAGGDLGSSSNNETKPESGTTQGGDGDYAFGTDRDDMVTAIESAYSKSNASATWEGDRMVLSIDGDADGLMPGFSECRVVTQLLLETDKVSIKFPNGIVACEEVLAD